MLDAAGGFYRALPASIDAVRGAAAGPRFAGKVVVVSGGTGRGQADDRRGRGALAGRGRAGAGRLRSLHPGGGTLRARGASSAPSPDEDAHPTSAAARVGPPCAPCGCLHPLLRSDAG